MQRSNNWRTSSSDVMELSDVLVPEETVFDDEKQEQWHLPPISERINFSEEAPYEGRNIVRESNWDAQSEEYVSDLDDDEEEHREKMFFYSNLFRMVGIVIGAAAILLMVALLIGLINWLRYDILHSAFLLQSGL